MQANIIGWDIGGAHVKAAAVNSAGEIIAIYQQPCPLWKGLDQLQQAVTAIMQELPDSNSRHAQLVHGEPILNPAYNRPITVQAQQETHAS